MTDFFNAKGMSREDIVAKIVVMTDSYADCRLDATGNTKIMFGPLKGGRRVATCYDRSPTTFLSAIALAATVIFWL